MNTIKEYDNLIEKYDELIWDADVAIVVLLGACLFGIAVIVALAVIAV